MGDASHHHLADTSPADGEAGDLVALMRTALPSTGIEHILIAGFDTQGRMLFLDSIGQGSRAAVAVDAPRLFASLATADLAAIILAHNHPSGDPTPSQGDIVLTARIAQIARFAGIALIDHLVFAFDRHVSFRALSLL